MAEALAVIGVVSSILQFAEVGAKVLARLGEFAEAADAVPHSFRHIKTTLPLVIESLQRIRAQAEAEGLDAPARKAVEGAVAECRREVEQLGEILDRTVPAPGAGAWERRRKAVASLGEDKRVKKIEKALENYVRTLTLYQTAKGPATVLTLNLVAPAPRLPVFTLLPSDRNPAFVGRDVVFKDIGQRLYSKEGSQPRAALAGLGGIGKSQIALEYCFRTRGEEPERSIFWVNAATPARFEESYKRIATECGFAPLEESASNTTPLVKSWLEGKHEGRWLMVVDNVDDRNAFFDGKLPNGKPPVEYVPRSARGAVLFTTRNRDIAVDLAAPSEPIVVSGLSRGEGHELIRERLPKGYDAEQASRFLEQLEYIPLAITQAVSFMIKRRKGIKEYLELFEKSDATRTKLLSFEFSDNTRSSGMESAARTWTISFEWIRDNHKEAADLLCLMSFFQRQDIPVELLRGEDEDDFDFEDRVATLCSFSLAESAEGGRSFNMHRLVQLATRWWLDQESAVLSDVWAARALAALTRGFPASTHHPDEAYWVSCNRLDPHAELLLFYQFKSPPAREAELDRATLLVNTGRYIDWRGAREEGLGRFAQSHAIRTRILGEKHPDALTSLAHVVWERSHRGDDPGAEPLGRQLLDLRTEVLGPDHPDTIDALSDYASAVGNRGDAAAAEALHRDAVARSERVLGPEHPDTLNCRANLADALYDAGRFRSAEMLRRATIPAQRRVLGADHVSVLIAEHALANCLVAREQFHEAVPLLRALLARHRRAFGLNHWETLMVVIDLCHVLGWAEGDWAEVGRLAREAIAAVEAGAGEGAEGLNDYGVGVLLRRLREYVCNADRMAPLGRAAPQDAEELWSPDDEETRTLAS